MKIEHAHPIDAEDYFPNDVENALTFLRYCLADLRDDIDRANDDGLRAMIEVILLHHCCPVKKRTIPIGWLFAK